MAASEDVVGVHGVFLGLCDLRVGVHVCSVLWLGERVFDFLGMWGVVRGAVLSFHWGFLRGQL